MSNEPINNAKNTWKHVKVGAMIFILALLVFVTWQVWKQPGTPVLGLRAAIWLIIFFGFGFLAGRVFFRRRRR
jgi:membrane-anchored protein YejM (alkaline phosphatase superfamily)